MRIWITGKNGLLGRTLCRNNLQNRFLTASAFPHNFDPQSRLASRQCSLAPDQNSDSSSCFGISVQADLATGKEEVEISDLDQVLAFGKKNGGITHIVNCAAFSLVDKAEQEKKTAFAANVEGPRNLAILAKTIGASLIHISTDYVFPGNIERPLHEDDAVLPCNYYGKTKLEGEKAVLDILPSACIIRTSWIFGKGGKNFIAQLLRMLQEEEEIRLTADHFGRPTYASDLAQAIFKMLDAPGGVYHFANSCATNKYLFGVTMKEIAMSMGLQVKTKRITPVPSSMFPSIAKRPAYSVFDTQKIEKHLGAIRSWQEALAEYLQSVIEQYASVK